MSFMTLGIYEFYWFYRNWSYIRNRDSVSIRPFWRAFFAPLHFRRLMTDVDAHRATADPISGTQASRLVIAYFILTALWRLPDPYWLVSMFSWVVLLPVVTQIAAINRPCPRELLRNSAWGFKHFVLGGVMLPLILLNFKPLNMITPSAQTAPEASMWQHNVEFLDNAGLLEKGEEVLYFYSQGRFSVEEDGNMLTDSKVVSYWIDEETDNFLIEVARYDEIASVDTEYSDTHSEHTVITVQRHDGSQFVLLVSAEGNRDVPFVDALEARIP